MKKAIAILLVIFSVTYMLKAQTKKVLLEEFTGVECGNCPMGSFTLDSLLEVYPDLIGVSMHSYSSSDSMFFPQIDTIGIQYSPGAPLGATDRIYDTVWGYVAQTYQNWNACIQTRLAVPPQLTVSVNASWNSVSRNISAGISTNILANLPSGDYRFNLYLVEDSVIGTGPGYDQVNFYNTIVGNPFYGMGNPITGYIHRHVIRAILPKAWGQAGIIASSPAAGQNFATTIDYTLPADYNENRIKLVAFVSRYTDNHQGDEVLNVDDTSLVTVSGITEFKNENHTFAYPNPTTGCFAVPSEMTCAELTIYNIFGGIAYIKYLDENTNVVNISALNNGIYFISLNNGKISIKQKIILNKNAP